jgi:hypothetical protein
MRRPLKRVTGALRRRTQATIGQLIDSPSGRIARAQEIDAAWQSLWRDQYTRHVPDDLREAFELDYTGWQQTKEQLGKMSAPSLMLPATGDLLDRWTQKSANWFDRFRAFGVQPSGPQMQPPAGPTDVAKIVWGVAAVVGAVGLVYALSKLPAAKPRYSEALL